MHAGSTNRIPEASSETPLRRAAGRGHHRRRGGRRGRRRGRRRLPVPRARPQSARRCRTPGARAVAGSGTGPRLADQGWEHTANGSAPSDTATAAPR